MAERIGAASGKKVVTALVKMSQNDLEDDESLTNLS
jgi:hypothetical protein